MKVYHGNRDTNLIPQFGVGKSTNDYGCGFYTTQDIEIAKELAWGTYANGNKAYVHTYELDLRALSILNFTELDSLHWVAELLANRRMNYNGFEAVIDREVEFIRKYKCDTSKYDIVIGYRADSSYFRYAVDFINASIYKDTMESALRYDILGLQVFIKSKKAFNSLTKVRVEEVDKRYERLYKDRDIKANKNYERIKRNQTSRKRETIFDFV